MSSTITITDTSGHLDMVFNLSPQAWCPRADVYAQALQAAVSTGSAIPSNQAVYAALRLRGFKESKRNGVRGFRGISPSWSTQVVQRHHNNPDAPIEPTPWLVEQTDGPGQVNG